MRETPHQTEVTNALVHGDIEKLTMGLTENGNAVTLSYGEKEAAYTALEARAVARELNVVSHEEWDTQNDDIVEYIHDLADVVDNDMTKDEFQEKWDNRESDQRV